MSSKSVRQKHEKLEAAMLSSEKVGRAGSNGSNGTEFSAYSLFQEF